MNKETKNIFEDNSVMKLSKHFGVPDGYFEKMESEVMFRALPQGEIFKNKLAFLTPELYFEKLSSNIQAKKESVIFAKKQIEEFEIPKEYFLQLEKQIEDRIKFRLNNSTKTSFDVSDSYFNELPRKIQNQINNKQKVLNKLLLPLQSQPRLAFSAALTVLIIAVVIINPFKADLKTKCYNELACLNKKDIEKHIENKLIQDIDENDIIEMIYENGNDFKLNKKILPEEIKDVEDYLINNTSDNSEIDEL